MNHMILTNQIMPSLTEVYLGPCPPLSLSLSLSLSALSLSPTQLASCQAGNKESLGQITPLHVVTLGPTLGAMTWIGFPH
jgi:hypothetical protein